MKTGRRPSSTLAIKSMCCDCRAEYSDGRQVDCKVASCPLYKKMPYRSMTPDYSWLFGEYTTKHRANLEKLGMTKTAYIQSRRAKSKSWPGTPDMFRAKCFRCCNNFDDRPLDLSEEEKGGRGWDCKMTNCPIYYWMPYRELVPTYDWIVDLSCNKSHETNMIINCMTREEYIDSILGEDDSE